jgi:hypothetical protein
LWLQEKLNGSMMAAMLATVGKLVAALMHPELAGIFPEVMVHFLGLAEMLMKELTQQ